VSVAAEGGLERRGLAMATAALLVGIFAVGSEALVISPLLADIAGDLGVSIERAALAVGIYGLAVAITAPFGGALSDRVGRRRAILAGLGVFALGGAASAAAPSLAALLVGRALCGLGAGTFLPAAYSWVGDEVPYEERARVMGRVVSGWAAAIVVGVPIGALVGQISGWREALALMAVLALAGALASARLVPAVQRPGGASRRVGIVRALAIPTVGVLLAVNLLDMFAFYGVYTYLGSFVREELDVRSGAAGALILLYGVGVAVVSLNGSLLDRVGKERALLVFLLALAVIVAVVPLLGGVPALLGLGLVALGLAQGGFLTCMTTIATNASEAARGTVVALMSCTTYIGVTLGAALMGPVFAGPGFRAVGAITALSALAGAVTFAAGQRSKRRHPR
jgi:MFS transporter, DHA1 family, inner membrane transport protein